jgi:two-component system CheB/CheR fusion protein
MENYSLHLQKFESPQKQMLFFKGANPEIKKYESLHRKWTAQEKIDNIQDRLARAGVGFWSFYCGNNLLELCQVSARITQLQNVVSLYTLMKQLHPLSRKNLFLNIIALLKANGAFEQEAHIVLPDGESRWFRLTGVLEQAKDGSHRVAGTLVDVTAYKLAEMDKTNLMAFMSHELKTPLSTMKLYVQSAAKFINLKNGDFLKSQLSKADDQVWAMNKLIDNYLHLSMAAHTGPAIQCEWFDFSALVYETVSHYAEVNPDHVFKMELNGSLFLNGDRDKITQVMNNFMGNAIKFSPMDGFIRVSCKKASNGVEFSVMDQGTGIALEDQKQLFTKHYRANNARMGKVKGHGLGLYLSKQIIESHKGSVFCESELGMGSVFGFVIPHQAPN